MRDMPAKIMIGLALMLAVTVLNGCAESEGRVVAHVGGSWITQGQLSHWAKVLAAAARLADNERQVTDTALDFLIRARWAEQAAHSEHIEVGNSEAEQLLWAVQYARVRSLPHVAYAWEAQLASYLTSPAASSGDRLWLMRLSALYSKLQHVRLSRAERAVSQVQVVRYYRDHLQHFIVPEYRDIAIMESSSLSAMLQARRAMMAGMDLATVAKRFSKDPVDPGGFKFHYRKGPGAPALDRAIFSAAPHVVVGPLQVYWYYVFEVLKIARAHPRRLREVEAGIRRTLAQQESLRHLEREDRLLQISRTYCRAGYRATSCGRYA
jgi:hypothetical protein